MLISLPTISFPGLGIEGLAPNEILAFVGGWSFKWYGAIIALGFALAAVYCLTQTNKFGIEREEFVDMLLFIIPVSIICARLYYVIFNWEYFAGDFSRIYKVWTGGLAVYGGIIGGVLTVFVFSRVRKLSFGALADLGGMGLFIGQAVGRWGNFINREAFGTETELPWRMGLEYSSGAIIYVHPTFLYESLWNVAGFLIAAFVLKKRRKYDGQIFLFYVLWYGAGRALIEGLRTDSLYIGSSGIRVSQLLGIITALAAFALLLYNRFFKVHRPEELFVNRRAAMAEASAPEALAEAVAIEEPPEDADEVEEDEEAKARRRAEFATLEPLDGDMAYEPDIEPIEVVLRDNEGE